MVQQDSMLTVTTKVALRSEDESRTVWSLIGLAVRLGHALGLHRDGDGSSLPPFKAEMRRRLWWELCVLDARACEDRGSDPMIIETTFNTEMPLHIDDADIDPQSSEMPAEKVGFTEATFCRMTHEVTMIVRRLNYAQPREIASNVLDLEGKVDLITQCQRRVEDTYLVHCNTSVPIQWATSVIGRLIMSRLWLMIQYPFHRGHAHFRQAGVSRELLLQTAIEVMESAHMLETNPDYAKWIWMAKTYVQWHALAVTLAEVCVQTNPVLLDRAWALIDVVFEPWSQLVADTSKGLLWRPIKKLYAKAQAARQKRQNTAQAYSLFSNPASDFKSYPTTTTTQHDPRLWPNTTPAVDQPGLMSIKDAPGFRGEAYGIQQPQQSTLPDAMESETTVPQLSDDVMDSINWMDWDAFIQDTQNAAQLLQFDGAEPSAANRAFFGF